MKVLVVEDHQPLVLLLEEHLTRNGFAVDTTRTGRQAITALRTSRYDALILDLGLPDMDGAQVLLARNDSQDTPPPCIVLTARDALESRVRLLNSGADDYVLKPFDMPELVARLRAVYRRSAHGFTSLRQGNMTFEPDSRHVVIDGSVLDLPRRESMLLEEMLRAAPRIVVKDTLEERLYSFNESVTANAIEALVSRLRRKLALAGANLRIDTVRGVGYRLVPLQAGDDAP